MGKERSFQFDPRDLITDPFIECPRCSRSEFGILMIGGNGYSRRCRSCLHRGRFELPPIRKRVLLLDQFVLSNLVFALRSDLPQHARVQPYYRELFDLLDRLVKLQIIVCPTSPTHYEESVVSQHYHALSRIGEHLGSGCSFWHASEVRRFQLSKHCWNWVQGRPEDPPSFDVSQFVHGDLHAWSDRILLTVQRRASVQDIEAIRKERERVRDGLDAIFSAWKAESLAFDQRFARELASFAPAIFRQRQRFLDERDRLLDEMQRGLCSPTLEALLPPSSVTLLHTMWTFLKDRGMNEQDAWASVERYLHSDALQSVPCLRISSMLWAAIARKAGSGQKRPPSQGMSNDIETASAILPYVDAALLDNEVRALLNEEPLRSRSGVTAQLFSPNTVDHFLTYLRGLLDATPREHIELSRSIYGDAGLEPYWAMLADNLQEEQARHPTVDFK